MLTALSAASYSPVKSWKIRANKRISPVLLPKLNCYTWMALNSSVMAGSPATCCRVVVAVRRWESCFSGLRLDVTVRTVFFVVQSFRERSTCSGSVSEIVLFLTQANAVQRLLSLSIVLCVAVPKLCFNFVTGLFGSSPSYVAQGRLGRYSLG